MADIAKLSEVKKLVRKAKKGDNSSFETLYELYYKDLYKMALYMTGDSFEAENIVSDTVLDAYASLDKLKDDGVFKSWIIKILINKCKRARKNFAEKKEKFESEPVEEKTDLQSGIDIQKKVEEELLVKQAFLVLDEEEKEIVIMKVYGEYNSSEIGKVLNLKPNTVRSKYKRALEKMKDKLAG